jgi:uncharacterized protein YecT (DUF1311 family)
VAALLASGHAHAGGGGVACDSIAALDDLIACHETRYAEADEALNRTYVALMERLDAIGHGERKPLLRESQRGWITFRDAECEFAASRTNGDVGYPLVLAKCLADMTHTRTAQLQRYLVCRDRDIDCLRW